MIPLQKHSYPQLGQLKFRSRAYILLVNVATLWVMLTYGKLNWIGMIWKGTHVLIQGLTAEIHFRAKTKHWGKKKEDKTNTACIAQIQDCIKPHIWGWVQKKKSCIEGSQKHVASNIHNGRYLEQPGLFLELASWQNWSIDGVVTNNLMVTLVKLHDHMWR